MRPIEQQSMTVFLSPHFSIFKKISSSNRRYLDMKKLCPNSSSKMIACGTTKKAIEILNTPRFNVNKGIIINTGVNDIDHMATENLVKDQVHLVNTATIEHSQR